MTPKQLRGLGHILSAISGKPYGASYVSNLGREVEIYSLHDREIASSDIQKIGMWLLNRPEFKQHHGGEGVFYPVGISGKYAVCIYAETGKLRFNLVSLPEKIKVDSRTISVSYVRKFMQGPKLEAIAKFVNSYNETLI